MAKSARAEHRRPRNQNPESNKTNKLRVESHLSTAKGIRCGRPKTQFLFWEKLGKWKCEQTHGQDASKIKWTFQITAFNTSSYNVH